MNTTENIYEATFNFYGILVMVDILTISNDEVSIYEVKSSTEVKDIYLHDVSIQYYVLKNLGFKIKSANVIHINNEYIRGDELDINQLFKIVDVTNEVISMQSNIPNILQEFETYQQAIPLYKGLKAYEQIPFQYSLHIEYEDGTLEHKEYLAEDSVDSRYELALRLCEDIPKNATVLAYNMSFEKGVMKRLATLFEEFSEHLLAINENMQDLMVPFQKKWYVTPHMNGSYSIKYVLPALVPEFEKAYKELDGIQNGSQAMNAFARLSSLDEKEKQKLRNSLLQYCKLDTLAMVKILERLRGIV